MARSAAKQREYGRRYRAENLDKIRAYYRAYMADYRQAHPQMRVVVDRPRACRYPRLCATTTPHRHCCCGLPVGLDAHACQVCIREQARREHRPIEEAA
jgi:hypothetical protein